MTEVNERLRLKFTESATLIMFNIKRKDPKEVIPIGFIPTDDRLDLVIMRLGFEYLVVNHH